MNTKLFKDRNGNTLRIDSRKNAIYFYYGEDQTIDEKVKEVMKNKKRNSLFSNPFQIKYNFSKEQLSELFKYLYLESNQSWSNITLKQAHSLSSDYFNYYDRELDNEGCMSLRNGSIAMDLVSPYGSDSSRLYKFTKPKMQSFLYDLKKSIGGDLND